MKRFRETIDEFGIGEIYAYGTSALRNAANGPTLANEITSATGIPIRIISGEEEADLIFAGIRDGLDLGVARNLVMDIGAGSVEFIVGDRRDIFWKQSFEIGGQRLLERFHKHDPISPDEITALNEYFVTALESLRLALQTLKPDTLVGSSGTFDTLSEIYCTRRGIPYDPNAAETPFSIEGFHETFQELISKNRDERMQIPGMIVMRVDMIVVACCLVRYVLDFWPFKDIRVSTYSLKEGALALFQPGT
jgi:exopolyphosphatase/guanosine-5'-triphosphate,3'-diphosphate pyrophosphatase